MIKSEVKDVRISCLLIFFKNIVVIILSKSLNQPLGALQIQFAVPHKLVIFLVVFGVSDQAILNPACSATETSKKGAIFV